MYQSNFKRVEQKYLVDKNTKEKLLEALNKYVEKDKFYISNIHNIYFDTKSNDLIRYSLEKPVFKDKFRIRSYGNGDDIFLEIKTKYKGIVGKRRIKMSISNFNKIIKEKEQDYDNQILKEFMYYYNYYDLKPAIYIAYDRESYKGIEDNNLRITFDSNIRSRRNSLDITYHEETERYFDNDMYILEIKSVDSLPLWLVRILSELKIYPYSFSKYGKIYEKENKREEKIMIKEGMNEVINENLMKEVIYA